MLLCTGLSTVRAMQLQFWDYRGCSEQRLRHIRYLPPDPDNGNHSVLEGAPCLGCDQARMQSSRNRLADAYTIVHTDAGCLYWSRHCFGYLGNQIGLMFWWLRICTICLSAPRPPLSHTKTVLSFLLRADFRISQHWQNQDYVLVRSALGHAPHALRMRHYQASPRNALCQLDCFYTRRLHGSMQRERSHHLTEPRKHLHEQTCAAPDRMHQRVRHAAAGHTGSAPDAGLPALGFHLHHEPHLLRSADPPPAGPDVPPGT